MSTVPKSDTAIEFGQWLSRQRKARDLTQEDLAERTKCSVWSIQKIEVGTRRPSKQVAEILADFFAIPDAEREAFLLFARGHGSYGKSAPAHDPTTEDSDTRDRAPGIASPNNNLQVQLTSFVGRDIDLPRIRDMMLTSDVRLLTLTGPPGTGKTRLALQVAVELLNEKEFEDGVYFVDLAPTSDPALVLSEISQVLGAVESGAARPQLVMLQDFLKEKRLLLVLDNFEQVVEAAPRVAELLMSSLRLKVLVTSREFLQVRGERNYPVPPLQMPNMRQFDRRKLNSIPLERLSQYEAIRLFIERAVAVKPDFTLTRDNAQAVAEICYHLDGLPLAIELAAARIRLFSPQALLSRLESRLKLLTGGARDLTARQQTLRGAIDWSYNLLDQGEQQLFRRLAVFHGGRTLEAVEAICNAYGDLRVDVLDGIASLMEKNLLQQRADREGEPRFVMLETIHEYAREKLRESGEEDALEREHAWYFAKRAEEAEPHLTRADQQEWLDRLEDEYDNFRVALSRMDKLANEVVGESETSSEASEISIRMAGALWRFWFVRGLYTEGIEHLRRVLSNSTLSKVARIQRAGEQKHTFNRSSTRSRVIALNGAGRLAWRQGDYRSAESYLLAALAIAGEVDDKFSMASSLNDLGTMAYEHGDIASARALYEESLTLKRQIGDRHAIAVTLNNLGNTAQEQGDYSSARALFEECLDKLRHEEDASSVAYVLNNLGNVAHAQGSDTLAHSLHKESLTVHQEIGDKHGIATSFSGLGVAMIGLEQTERGVRLFGASEALLEAIDSVLERLDRLPFESGFEQARTLLGEEAFEKARQEGRGMSLGEAVDYALEED